MTRSQNGYMRRRPEAGQANATWSPALMSAAVAAVVSWIRVSFTIASAVRWVPLETSSPFGPLFTTMALIGGFAALDAVPPRREVGVLVGLVAVVLALLALLCSPTLMPMPSPASRAITIAIAREPRRKRGERSSTVPATVRLNERLGSAAMYLL